MNDMKKLKLAILNQSIQDYIKLQHPKYRSKKYLEESFIYSVNMFFDPCYSFLYFFNEEGEHESTLEFISSTTNTSITSLQPMKDYLKEQSILYWDNKKMKTFTIPPYLVYNGLIYNILMSESDNKIKIDYEKNEIFFDKKDKEAEKIFIEAFIQIVQKEQNLKLSDKDKNILVKSIHDLLKMNNLYIKK